MMQQNTQKEIESAPTVRDRNLQSKESAADVDAQVASQPTKQNSSFLEKFCDSNPDAAECRVYDV